MSRLKVIAWSAAGGLVAFVVVLALLGLGPQAIVWTVVVLGVLSAAVYVAVRMYAGGLQEVPPGMVGVVHRKYGRSHPADVHAVRIYGSPGPQAKVINSGRVPWLLPGRSRLECFPLTEIQPGYVGLVTAMVGTNLSTTDLLARHVDCDHFQDGVAFLAGGGQQGPQPMLLAAGRYHLNPYMFSVAVVPQTRIAPNRVGLVTARIGRNLPLHSPVARHVDCDYFQNTAEFLRGGGEQGPQPMLLTGGGVYNLNPHVFSVREIPQTHIEPGHIGVVTARVGRALPLGTPVAHHVDCEYFQNGPAFLAGGGAQGPQPGLLAGGVYYNVNPSMFAVESIPQTHIRPGRIGVVVARVGQNLPHGRPFGRHVECDYFQNGPLFLQNGGQQGPQLALLTGGNRYNVNPHMFEVITEDNVDEQRSGLTKEDLTLVKLFEGNTGVVVVREGAPAVEGLDLAPRIDHHDRFQLPWVFLEQGGQQGTQAETLPGGADYAINPWFARVVRIPTRELILEWDDRIDKDGDRYDSALEPIKATIEGHAVRVHLTQSLRIPPEAAPILVKRFGEQETEDADQFGFVNKRPAPVKRFVERILGSLVSGYFSTVSAQYKITDFVDRQHEVQADLQDTIQRKMEEWSVNASNTTLVQIAFEDEIFNKMRQKLVAARANYPVLEQEERNTEVEQRTKERKLETHRKRLAIEAGTELQVLVDLLGRDQVLKERFVNLLTQFDVPQVVAGSGDVGALSDFISPSVIMDVLNQVMHEPRNSIITSRIDRPPPAHPDSTQIEDGSS